MKVKTKVIEVEARVVVADKSFKTRVRSYGSQIRRFE